MFLITGAGGKTGKAVLRRVAESGGLVRAWVYRDEQAREVKALGAQEVIVGDMRDQTTARQAMRNISSVYHICPNVHPDEISIARAIIDAAVATGVTHFVFHSVLHPQIEAMPHHWKKMRVEEYLFTTGLPFTILQPASYMQNLLVNWDRIEETGKYSVPYSVNSLLSLVDLEDVALAATKILTEINPRDRTPLHIGATYELAGTSAMTPSDMAAILAEQLGRLVIAEQISIPAWKQGARNSGMGAYQVDTLINMFEYYSVYGFWSNTQVLSWLLKRPATSFEVFVKRENQARLQDVQSSGDQMK